MPATALDLAGQQLQAYLDAGTVQLRQVELLHRARALSSSTLRNKHTGLWPSDLTDRHLDAASLNFRNGLSSLSRLWNLHQDAAYPVSVSQVPLHWLEAHRSLPRCRRHHPRK